MKLITTPNLPDPDEIYQKLITLHDGRSEDQSMRVNARLILLLINHVGDPEAVSEAIAHAASLEEQEQ